MLKIVIANEVLILGAVEAMFGFISQILYNLTVPESQG